MGGSVGLRAFAEQQVPPLRSPVFPVEISLIGEVRAPLFEQRGAYVAVVKSCEAGNPGPLRSG